MSKLTILFLSLLISATVIANDAIVGIWSSDSGKALVQIYRVNDKYYGKVVQLKNPMDETGALKVDKKNPDPTLKSKPIVGLIVLRDLVYNEDDDEWTNGKIYNPDDGKIYKCLIKLKDDNTMDVRGYIGISCFGKSQTMYRVK
jgi:uncharacterized protein (DUF2147 family)